MPGTTRTSNPIIIGAQKIYEIDCLDGFAMLEDDSIDHISTSPPYNLGGFHADRKLRSYADFSDDMPEEQYRDFIKQVIRESYRVLKQTGSFFLNMKTRIIDGVSIPPFWVLEDNPFYLKQEIIWHYPSTANVDKIRFFPLFEYVFWFIKDLKEWTRKWNNEWAIIGDVWEISHITDRNETKVDEGVDGIQHPAPFPTQLSQTMILSTTCEGDTVLDPFVGSGTTLKVCRKYKRNGIGFEKFLAITRKSHAKESIQTIFPRHCWSSRQTRAGKSENRSRHLTGSFNLYNL